MSPSSRRPSTLIIALAVTLLMSLVGGSATPRGAAWATTDDWNWPLEPPHTITAPYRAPATPYAAGHRGIDLSARSDRPVLAPADGVVSFVGVVVDRPVLAIAHSDNLVSSFEPVLASVVVGDQVVTGQRVGTIATGGHCLACLHFGVRRHGEYVSPLLLLGGVPRAVLLPLGPG